MQLATRVSITETHEVNAANPTMRKNASPTIRPKNPIEANTFGREIKIKLGPDA